MTTILTLLSDNKAFVERKIYHQQDRRNLADAESGRIFHKQPPREQRNKFSTRKKLKNSAGTSGSSLGRFFSVVYWTQAIVKNSSSPISGDYPSLPLLKNLLWESECGAAYISAGS
jgi:hypothetical protein